MHVMVCVPSGWLVKADPVYRIFSFVSSSLHHKVSFRMSISNRVDLNRSLCVKYALESNEPLIMLDSDVVPLTPFDDVIRMVREDLRHADIVIGVVASSLGVLTIPKPTPGVDVYPVESGSLSFVYVPLRVLRSLPVLSWYGGVPMYFLYSPTTSEDGDFLLRCKSMGYRVLADRRIRLAHVKDTYLSVDEKGEVKGNL